MTKICPLYSYNTAVVVKIIIDSEYLVILEGDLPSDVWVLEKNSDKNMSPILL